ncbi:MAG: cytochrome c oxidase assembly protein, partial [Hyphomicrobiaceae bacterium]
SMEMPVSFFVDPAIVRDKDAARLSQITLSYTFFPVDDDPAKSATPRKPSGARPRVRPEDKPALPDGKRS